MTYEVILTDKCNRNCSFCDFKKTGYVETCENIRRFYSTFDKRSRYTIVLFGGEPLLNINGVNEMMHLVENDDCEIKLITNGDFIDRMSQIYNGDRIKIQVSAYDVFEEPQKYVDIYGVLGDRLHLSYVFTENDIDRVDEYSRFCEGIGVKYIYSLSHSERSWENIDILTLKKKIENLGYYEMARRRHVVIDRYVKRFVELKTNGRIRECCCIDLEKTILHRGRIIRGCVMFDGFDIEDIMSNTGRCHDCYYRKVCFKSCFYERKLSNVPEKLCLIEKALIDCAYRFVMYSSNSPYNSFHEEQ